MSIVRADVELPPLPSDTTHICHVPGCGKQVPPELLMCPDEWALVPAELKQAVTKSYTPGQCFKFSLIKRAWVQAAHAAIEAVVAAKRGPELPPLGDVEEEDEDADEYARHKSSKKENYVTPDPFLDLVRKMGPIGLDPCSNVHSHVRARVEYRLDHGQDGLVLPWAGFGLVFKNPPYGRKTRLWMARARQQAMENLVEIVGLVGGRPDTGWLHDCGASHICFWRGRLTFIDGDTGLPMKDPAIFPQAVPYWGVRGDLFREVFGPYGKVVAWG